MAKQRLLTAGFRIWDPDFEGANFSLDELAEAAAQFAQGQGSSAVIFAADISTQMQSLNQAAGKAIEKLLRDHRLFTAVREEVGLVRLRVVIPSAAKRDLLRPFITAAVHQPAERVDPGSPPTTQPYKWRP